MDSREPRRGLLPFPLAEIREAACLLAPVVVVPSTAPKVKTDAIEYYGAELVTVAPTMAARIAATEELVAEHGMLIPPFDDRAVIAGQGTTGRSIVPFDRQPKLYLGRIMAVGDRSGFSAQTLAVLAELCATPSRWRHGYGIARDTGLKSGTLYPILLRLADRGLVEACWEDEQPAGRPRRHLYRLTTEGLAAATAALAQAQSAGQVRAGSRIRGRRRVAARAAP